MDRSESRSRVRPPRSAVLLAGCSSFAASGATGTLAKRVSDRPGDIDDFESCVITIDTVTVKPAESEGTATGEDGGLETIDAGGATADLGYPRAVEVEPGRVLAVYYLNTEEGTIPADGGVRHIASTAFDVPG